MSEIADFRKFKERKDEQKRVQNEKLYSSDVIESLELKIPDLNKMLPEIVLDAVEYKPSRCAGQIALRAGVLAMVKYDLTKIEDYYLTNILIEETESILRGLTKYVTSEPGQIKDIDTDEMITVPFYSLKTPEDPPEIEENDGQELNNVFYPNFGRGRKEAA